MTTTINVFQAQVEILLGPDDSRTELTDLDIQKMVKAAVERYSRDTPDSITEDEAGDGGKYYALSGLASWVEDSSRITAIEYPAEAISADTPPQYLEDEDWRTDYYDGATQYLFLPNHNPASGETMRITYTAPYTWSGSPEIISTPSKDFYAICQLAAGLCCQAIATKYSRTNDSTITADSVAHIPRSSQFAARAKMYIEQYETHLGLGGNDGKPPFQQGTGTFIDMDTEPTWGPGRQFLFHGKGTR